MCVYSRSGIGYYLCSFPYLETKAFPTDLVQDDGKSETEVNKNQFDILKRKKDRFLKKERQEIRKRT